MIEALRSKPHVVISLIVILLLGLFFYINLPFAIPFILAGIFALGLQDFVSRMTKRWKLPRWLIITLVMIAGLAIFWIPLSLAVYRGIMAVKIPENLQGSHLTEQLDILKNFTVELVAKVSNIVGVDLTSPVRQTLENLIRKSGELILSFSSDIIRSAPSIVFNGFMFLVFLAALLGQAEAFKRFIMKYSVVDDTVTEKMIQVLKISCSVTLFSTFIVGLIQAGIIGFGSLIFGEGDFWLVTPVTFVLSFIPVIGAGPVGYLISLLAFLGNRTGAGIGMLVIAIVASTIDNVLKPLLIGGKDKKIPALLGFTCVLGAIVMMGLPGLLLGPVLLNVVIRAVPLLPPELKNHD